MKEKQFHKLTYGTKRIHEYSYVPLVLPQRNLRKALFSKPQDLLRTLEGMPYKNGGKNARIS